MVTPTIPSPVRYAPAPSPALRPVVLAPGAGRTLTLLTEHRPELAA